MKYIVDVSDYLDEIEILERAHYEVQTRKDILNLMIVDGFNEDNDIYKNYWELCLKYVKIYEDLKNNFYNKYLSEYKGKTWSLNFLTKQVIIHTEN